MTSKVSVRLKTKQQQNKEKNVRSRGWQCDCHQRAWKSHSDRYFFWHMSYIIFEYKSDEIDLNVRVVVRTFYYNKLLYDYTSNNVVYNLQKKV